MDTLIARCHTAARLSGPLVAASLVLLIASEVTATGTEATSGSLVMLAGVVGLVGALALLFGVIGLHASRAEHLAGRATLPAILMIAGAALTVGAMWDLAFVVPVLVGAAPELLEVQQTPVLIGYLVAYGLLGVGALAWTVSQRRARLLSAGQARLLIAGSLLCLTPLPNRFVLLAIGVGLVARRTPAERTEPIGAAA